MSLQRRSPGHLPRKPELGWPDPPGCGIELLLADSKTFLDQLLGQGSLGFGSALRGAGWEPELGTEQEASPRKLSPDSWATRSRLPGCTSGPRLVKKLSRWSVLAVVSTHSPMWLKYIGRSSYSFSCSQTK